MKLKLSKQAQKYLDSVDSNTRKKLYKALEQLSKLEGNIVKLKGTNLKVLITVIVIKSLIIVFCLNGIKAI